MFSDKNKGESMKNIDLSEYLGEFAKKNIITNSERTMEQLFADPEIPYNTWEEMLWYLDMKANRSELLRKQALENRMNGVNRQTILASFSFDNSSSVIDTIAEMDKCIEYIKQSNYKWLPRGKDSIYTYEFHSGRDSHWNPHIHLCFEKVGVSAGQVRQQLERSPARKKTTCYNVNTVKGNNDQHEKYVMGNKVDSKDVCVQKDEKLRFQYGIKSHYYL